MCGIVAYTGFRQARPILMEGIKRLEYRGYDSAGIAVQKEGDGLQVEKHAGRISVLESHLAADAMNGTCGISHTRWATHGAPNDRNAHPHLDATRRIALAHNGIIENYQTLRTYLEHHGVEFRSRDGHRGARPTHRALLQRRPGDRRPHGPPRRPRDRTASRSSAPRSPARSSRHARAAR